QAVIARANVAAAEMVGAAEKFLIGKPLATLLAPAATDHFRAVLDKARELEGVQETELELASYSGGSVPCTVRVSHWSHGDGTEALTWIARDVSALRRGEHERARAAQRAQKVRNTEEFLAAVAHEIWTPLQSLLLGVAAVKDSKP